MIRNLTANIQDAAIQIGSLLSRLLSVFVRNWFAPVNPDAAANMNLSARAYIRAAEGSRTWYLVEQFIDALFFWQEEHCAEVWWNRVSRAAGSLDRDDRVRELESMKAKVRSIA